jgi:hypothetical protein
MTLPNNPAIVPTGYVHVSRAGVTNGNLTSIRFTDSIFAARVLHDESCLFRA